MWGWGIGCCGFEGGNVFTQLRAEEECRFADGMAGEVLAAAGLR